MIKAITEVDRIVRAGANYALVVVGLTGLVVAMGGEIASPGNLGEGELIAILAASSTIAVLGAALQVVVERSIRNALAQTTEAQFEASTKRLELTQQLYLEQLRHHKDASDVERVAANDSALRVTEAIAKTSLWPANLVSTTPEGSSVAQRS
jgi:hypothetical protein